MNEAALEAVAPEAAPAMEAVGATAEDRCSGRTRPLEDAGPDRAGEAQRRAPRDPAGSGQTRRRARPRRAPGHGRRGKKSPKVLSNWQKWWKRKQAGKPPLKRGRKPKAMKAKKAMKAMKTTGRPAGPATKKHLLDKAMKAKKAIKAKKAMKAMKTTATATTTTTMRLRTGG